jgi:hypothetical protein
MLFRAAGAFLLLQLLHHFLNEAVSSGAIFHILLVHVHVFNHFLFGQMRKSGAVNRPHFINGAHIILEVQKLAGSALIHPITGAFLFVQPFIFELLNAHAHVTGDPFDIFSGISRRHCLAAIGAAEAIDLTPNFLFRFNSEMIQIPGRVFLQPA